MDMEKAKTKKIQKPQKAEKAQKPKYNMWQNSMFMIRLAWKSQKNVLWLCLILAVLAVLSNLVELFIAPTVLGQVEASVPLHKLLLTICIFSIVLIIVGAINSYVNTNTIFGRISVRGDLVSQIHAKYAMTSYPNTEDQDLQKKLDKANMAVNSNEKATEAIWYTLTGLLQNAAGFCIYLALLSSLNLFIVVVTLATTIAGYYINKHIYGWGYRHRDEEAEYSRRMNYICNKSEDYMLAKDIRIFGMRGWLEGIYDSMLNLYQAFVTRGEKIYIWANVADVLFSFLRNGIAYIFLIGLTLKNGLPASQFLLYFSAVGGFTSWVYGIFSDFSTLYRQSLDISTVREFLEAPEPFRFEDGEPLKPDLEKPYEIKLKNVTFRYPATQAEILKNINLTIKAGEKLAIVGLNGAGKTTLVKLICGFYDPMEGEVLLNGKNIRDYNRRDYYMHFSAVFQQFSLLPVTIAENVAQSVDNIDMERVRACVRKAGLGSRIESMSAKYQTHIGREVYEDGVDLSGGETQRLMLARALYKNAPVILLDEPTAALDPIAESDIYQRYNELTGGRTSVYISHRLASTRFCDRIILIEDGTITEEGTHASLLEKGGKYAELFEIQSRYYREGEAEYEEAEKNVG